MFLNCACLYFLTLDTSCAFLSPSILSVNMQMVPLVVHKRGALRPFNREQTVTVAQYEACSDIGQSNDLNDFLEGEDRIVKREKHIKDLKTMANLDMEKDKSALIQWLKADDNGHRILGYLAERHDVHPLRTEMQNVMTYLDEVLNQECTKTVKGTLKHKLKRKQIRSPHWHRPNNGRLVRINSCSCAIDRVCKTCQRMSM